MIDHIWPERMAFGDIVVSVGVEVTSGEGCAN
jgi:hypothetical protein